MEYILPFAYKSSFLCGMLFRFYVHCVGCYLASMSIVSDVIRFYVHCAGCYLASMSIASDVISFLCPLCRMSSADFQRKSPFPYFSILKNLHISNIFCTFAPEFVKLGNCVTACDQIFVLRDTINRQIKPWQI